MLRVEPVVTGWEQQDKEIDKVHQNKRARNRTQNRNRVKQETGKTSGGVWESAQLGLEIGGRE